jgi:cytochrome P450
MSFGRSPHFCLGAALTYTEAETRVQRDIARFPNAKLAAEPRQRDPAILRALDALKISAEG